MSRRGLAVGFQRALSDISKMQNTRHVALAPCTRPARSLGKLCRTVEDTSTGRQRVYWVTGSAMFLK